MPGLSCPSERPRSSPLHVHRRSNSSGACRTVEPSNHRTSGSIGIWPAEPERNPLLAVASSGFECLRCVGCFRNLGIRRKAPRSLGREMIRAYRSTPIANQVYASGPKRRAWTSWRLPPGSLSCAYQTKNIFLYWWSEALLLTIGPMLMLFSSFGQTSMATSHDTLITRWKKWTPTGPGSDRSPLWPSLPAWGSTGSTFTVFSTRENCIYAYGGCVKCQEKTLNPLVNHQFPDWNCHLGAYLIFRHIHTFMEVHLLHFR